MEELIREKSYTYEDLLSWDDGNRYELYDGILVVMESPSDTHQAISMELARQLANFLVGKKCKAFSAPFDVRLFEKPGDSPEDVDTVVQPDLMVVCDQSKLDRHGIYGAPDLVVEIISPSTQRYDRLVKLDLYQRAGVQEYWIVDPLYRSVQVLTLTGGQLLPKEVYGRTGIARVNVLEGCFIDLSTVFPTNP